MPYSRTTWINGSGPALNATNLNNIEAALAKHDNEVINAKDSAYGAVGDGSADDTAALQSFITATANAHAAGYIPPGTYKITAKLNIPQTYGWKIFGAGPEATIIRQHTNNTPIFDVGGIAGASMHSWEISDLQFTYNSVQSSANTSATPILFSVEGYEGALERINFKRGYCGVDIGAGVTPPWGCTFDRLWFDSGMSGAAFDFSGGAGGGGPNNNFPRIFVDASNMVGPIFTLIGANTKLGVIEIIAGNQSPQLFLFKAGSHIEADDLKLEVGAYSSSQNLIRLETNSSLRLNHFRLSNTITVSGSAVLTVFSVQGATAGELATISVKRVDLIAVFNDTSKGYVLDCGTKSWDEIQADFGHITKIKQSGTSPSGWALTNHGGGTAAECVQRIGSLQTDKLSADQGDAAYTVTPGGPTTVIFKTAFTAARNIDLPATVDELYNGLKYRFLFKGAVNGANTAAIRANSVTLHTVSAADQAVEFTYRRVHSANAQSNWELTSLENISSAITSPLWFPNYKAANYYFSNSPTNSSTSNTLGNNSLRVSPLIITKPVTITRVGAEFTAAGEANSIFRIGIYGDDGTGVPTGAPILDAGSISTGTGNAGTVATGGTPGQYEITVSTALLPGLYWFGGAVQGAATTQPTMRTASGPPGFFAVPIPAIPSANQQHSGYTIAGVSGALPTWSGTSSASNAIPRMFFKVT